MKISNSSNKNCNVLKIDKLYGDATDKVFVYLSLFISYRHALFSIAKGQP